MIDYRLYLVTDDPSRYKGNWLDNVVSAVEGGVTAVQYRDTESNSHTQYERIVMLQDALKRWHIPIIVNNDAELARAVKAEGLHVGQNDMPVFEARRIVGNNCEIGLSITDIRQLFAFESSSWLPDALGIGPVFDARKTKADAAPAMGVEGLCKIVTAAKLRFPKLATVAIGGIQLDNIAAVHESGVDGIALVSAFSQVFDAKQSAKELMEVLK